MFVTIHEVANLYVVNRTKTESSTEAPPLTPPHNLTSLVREQMILNCTNEIIQIHTDTPQLAAS